VSYVVLTDREAEAIRKAVEQARGGKADEEVIDTVLSLCDSLALAAALLTEVVEGRLLIDLGPDGEPVFLPNRSPLVTFETPGEVG